MCESRHICSGIGRKQTSFCFKLPVLIGIPGRLPSKFAQRKFLTKMGSNIVSASRASPLVLWEIDVVPRGENTGGLRGVIPPPPPNLKNSRYRRAIKDFAGRQEELYCHAETPHIKFVKGRLGTLKWKYHNFYDPPFLALHFRERNRYARKSSVVSKAKAFLTESQSQWM